MLFADNIDLVQTINLKKAGAKEVCVCGEVCWCGLLPNSICSTSSAQIDAMLSNLFMKLYGPSSSNILLLFYFTSQIPAVKAEVISSRAATF